MAIKYPIKKIDGENIPWIRKKPADDERDFLEYKISFEDMESYPGNCLQHLAEKFYSDPALWFLIYELNAPLEPSEFTEGMVIKIPMTSAFRESPIITSIRKIT